MRKDERCDRCGAQAYVMTLHSGNALLWCNHHYAQHEHLLEAAVIIDERNLIDA